MEGNCMSFWDSVDEVIKRKSSTKHSGMSDVYANINNVDNRTEKPTESSHKETKEHDDTTKPEIAVVYVILMTAVEDEYRMARKVFRDIFAENYENGFKYCLANYKISEDFAIVIAIFRQNNMGLVSASMTATFALNKFNPKLLLMCGVCAGVKDKANLGDLIIFSPVFDYGSGKYHDGNFFPDYRQHHIDSHVRPIVEEMKCDINLKREIKDAWENTTGKPTTELDIHIYPGGSGAAVITDENVIKNIRDHQRTLGAIDMESYAIAEVANEALTREIPWLVVKGVQDFASPLKNDQYREYSAFVSATFVEKFLNRFFGKS